MTLVLSCLTEKYAIQVSDRRITYPNGELKDDYENKAVQYGALMAFAFSGCAYIGRQPTYEWLTEALASTSSLGQALNQVAARATEEFKKIPSSAPFKGLVFVGAGWSNPPAHSHLLPTYVTISNALEHGKVVQAVKEKFDITVSWLNDKFALLPPIGQPVPNHALNQLRKNISLCVEHNTNPLEIIRLFGRTIRSVARSNLTVSHNLLAVVVPKPSLQSDEVLFFNAPQPKSIPLIASPIFFDMPADTDQLTRISPSFVNGNVIISKAIFSSHTPAIDIYQQQIRSGIMPSELNEASLVAYANVSPLVDEFAVYLKSYGLGILEGSSSGFETLQLLKTMEIKSLSELDHILRETRSWVKSFLKDTFVNSQVQPPTNQATEPIRYVERMKVIYLLLRKRYRLP